MNHTFYGCASITNSERVEIINKQGIPGPGTYEPLKQDSSRIPNWTLKPKIQYTSCFHNFKKDIPAPGAYQTYTPKNTSFSKGKQNDLKNIKYKERNYIERSSPIIALQIPSFIKQNTGYSFGYRDQIIVKEKSPGPIYHVDENQNQKRTKKKLNSSMGFGYGQRNCMRDSDSPGPGNYSPSPQKNYCNASKWTFSKSKRKQNQINLNPTGPGQYNPQMFNTARSFKLKGRYKEVKNEQSSACPGSYQISDTKCKRSAIFKALTNSKNENSVDNGPSPFSYDSVVSTLKKGGYSLGKKIYITDQNTENPGPGTYQLQKNDFKKSGGYISKRLQVKKKASDTQDNFYKYNPKNQFVNFKYPQFSFRQSESIKQKKSQALGPGSYNINKKSNGQSYSIGKDRRFKPLDKEKSYGNLLPEKNYYSTIGCLPNYLKNEKRTNKQKKSGKQDKQNLYQQKQN